MLKLSSTLSRLCYSCLVLGAPLFAQLPVCPGSPAASEVNQGIKAYKDAQYAQAAEHLQAATQADPSCANARLYLGNAYMQQYIPGAESPENQALAEKAREQYEMVLDQQPENQQAMESIASLYFNRKKLDDAQVWYEKLAVVNPDNKAARYTLGVIAWTRSYRACTEARTKMGMKPDEPGPLKDAAMRQTLRARYLPVVQEGIDHLNRAIEIDAEYDDAMAYLNLLYRQKADLEDRAEDYRDDIAKADEWVQKSLDVRKEKAGRQP
jgi:tetratricopeptide (TPR) repeat protein